MIHKRAYVITVVRKSICRRWISSGKRPHVGGAVDDVGGETQEGVITEGETQEHRWHRSDACAPRATDTCRRTRPRPNSSGGGVSLDKFHSTKATLACGLRSSCILNRLVVFSLVFTGRSTFFILAGFSLPFLATCDYISMCYLLCKIKKITIFVKIPFILLSLKK